MNRIAAFIYTFLVLSSCSLSDKMNSVVRVPDNRFFSQDQFLISGNIIGEPDWSPDSQSIVLSLDGILMKITVSDNADNVILSDGIQRGNPKWSPDGMKILADGNGVWLMNHNGDNLTNITNNGFLPDWRSTDVISYLGKEDGGIFDDHFYYYDLNLLDHTMYELFVTAGSSISLDFKLSYYDSKAIISQTTSSALDVIKLIEPLNDKVSPLYQYGYNGKWVHTKSKIIFNGTAFIPEIDDFQMKIWTIKTDGSITNQLTFGNSSDVQPSISPDGNAISFVSDRNGSYDIWVMSADGSNLQLVGTESDFRIAPIWSPDSSMLLYSSNGALHVLKK